MNKLQQLLQQYCPDGVEWKMLGESLVRTKGTNITARQMKELHKDGAPLKIFAGGKTIAYVDFEDVPNNDISREPSIIVKSRGIIEFEYYDKPFTHKNEMWAYHSENENINIKFVYYYLKMNELYFQNIGSRMQMPQISTPDTDKYSIPIPPLPVQTEIVRILDKFSTLTAELQAELQARKSQYEFYRNQLLDYPMEESDQPSLRSSRSATSIKNNDNLSQQTSELNPPTDNSVSQQRSKVEWKTLEEIIISLKTGLNPRKNFQLNTLDATGFYVTVRELQNGNIVFVQQTDRVNKRALELINNRSNLEIGDVLFSGTGTVGRTTVIENNPENWNIKEGIYVIKPIHNLINSRFLAHLLHSSDIVKEYSKKIVGSPVISLPMNELKKLLIPIPPLTEQERIVSILDKFDTLTNSISEGLPKEIELRQKQYEYYRDMLLTFPQK